MKDFKIIEVKQSVFADNDADAERLRQQLKEEKTFLLNLMSSPGAGKTGEGFESWTDWLRCEVDDWRNE